MPRSGEMVGDTPTLPALVQPLELFGRDRVSRSGEVVVLAQPLELFGRDRVSRSGEMRHVR